MASPPQPQAHVSSNARNAADAGARLLHDLGIVARTGRAWYFSAGEVELISIWIPLYVLTKAIGSFVAGFGEEAGRDAFTTLKERFDRVLGESDTGLPRQIVIEDRAPVGEEREGPFLQVEIKLDLPPVAYERLMRFLDTPEFVAQLDPGTTLRWDEREGRWQRSVPSYPLSASKPLGVRGIHRLRWWRRPSK